jgi:hypothetical protein
MMNTMKRLQILLEEDLDEALARQALSEGTSKAALIRKFVRSQLGAVAPLESDPISAMVGADSFDPDPIDEVVYG